MTADNVTSSRLRELSRAASPAPWEVGRTSINGESLLRTDKVNDFASRSVQMQTANAALIVALRNDAEKYADLRDAGRALAARLHEMYLGAETREKLSTFVAALDALDGSAP